MLHEHHVLAALCRHNYFSGGKAKKRTFWDKLFKHNRHFFISVSYSKKKKLIQTPLKEHKQQRRAEGFVGPPSHLTGHWSDCSHSSSAAWGTWPGPSSSGGRLGREAAHTAVLAHSLSPPPHCPPLGPPRGAYCCKWPQKPCGRRRSCRK